VGETLIARLRSQGDEVRVVEADSSRAIHWRGLGALVAEGAPDNADLIERAAHDCRTLVIFDVKDASPAVLEAAIEGVRNTSVDRAILLVGGPADRSLEAVRSSGLDHIFLHARSRRGILRRRGPDASLLAEAIDAADDLAGSPRLDLDLSDPHTARVLGLHLGG
jgi:hypothetical protein